DVALGSRCIALCARLGKAFFMERDAPTEPTNPLLQEPRRNGHRLRNMRFGASARLGPALDPSPQIRLGQSDLASLAVTLGAAPYARPLRLARLRIVRPG